ncbi:MAG: lipid-A-disaccharide synthase [Geobacteraceae bacterium]|nr:lipid-A-disaccharide synthase [Geobacteraceae bacterium]
MIVAGEVSGDMYGARVVEEAHRIDSTVRFFGIGGEKMRAASVETFVDSKEMAVMGLFEVLGHFGTIYRAFRLMERLLKSEKPELLILIDYPGFNIRLAKVAKKAGIKILYYITPQVWAWHTSRVKKIAHLVDHAAVIFPFEVSFFAKEGLPVTFVGHPLLEMAKASMTLAAARYEFGLDSGLRTVGLFPGSRKSEINSLLPVILESAKILQAKFSDLQFILPAAQSVDRSVVDAMILESGLKVSVVTGKSYDVMQTCDVVIAASGTVTMEIALFGVPMVIVYKANPITFAIGIRLLKVDHVGICNIVAGERVVPELLQHDAEPHKIASEISRYLDDSVYAQTVRGKLLKVRESLGEIGAPRRVAEIVYKMMEQL